jgi:hypothetical protein
LVHNQEKLRDKKFEGMFGGLYKNLGTKRIAEYSFNVAFLIRRLMYALSVGTFFTSITLVSILVQILLSVLLCIYILLSRPFEDPRDNQIELMNELTILAIFYLCLGLITDDTLMSGEMRGDYGIAIIVLVMLNIFANFAIFIYGTFSTIKNKLKKCCHKKNVRIHATKQAKTAKNEIYCSQAIKNYQSQPKI